LGDVGAEGEMWVICGKPISQDMFAIHLKEMDKTKMKRRWRHTLLVVVAGSRLNLAKALTTSPALWRRFFHMIGRKARSSSGV